jgi:hypothetical protein
MNRIEILENKCRNCKYFCTNKDTLNGLPFCIKCYYCKKKKHILQINLDGTLPVFCQVCNPDKWKIEFDTNIKNYLKK